MKDDGLLVVYGGYNWNENTTPSSLWLGNNTADDGANVTNVIPSPEASAADLAHRLEPNFQLLQQITVPFFWAVSSTELKSKLMQISVFRKKNSV